MRMAKVSPERPAVSSAPRWLSIVGIGEDGREGLSAAALSALEGAAVVYGGRRHLALAAPLAAECRPWPSPIADAYLGILALRGRPVCILATGDPFHYGIGAEIEVVSAGGSVREACLWSESLSEKGIRRRATVLRADGTCRFALGLGDG